MMNKFLLAIALGLVTVGPAFAQDGSTSAAALDGRWSPYLGCWRIVQENVGAESVPIARGLQVCARAAGRSAVQITTSVDGKTVLEQTIVADATAQPITQAGCGGTQTSEWSRDGERLFTRAEIACEGRPARVVSGITLLAKGYWVDAQATIIDGNHDVRVRRYQRVGSDDAGAPAPMAVSNPMNIEDVVEASSKVVSPAVEAALVEAGGRFALNSRALEQLADAGVSPNVIDVMVAQAFPEKFQIERPSTYAYASGGGGSSVSSSSTSVYVGSSIYSTPYYDPFLSSYYYYSPFAYPYYWGSAYYPYRYRYSYGYYPYYNNNYYYYGGPTYGFSPRSPRDAVDRSPGSPDAPSGDGVVVKGRGYTRVRPSGSTDSGDASAPTQRTPSSRGVRSIGGSSDSGGSSSGGSSSSGNSGGGNSGGGNSSGGNSGGGGGRTAQPR